MNQYPWEFSLYTCTATQWAHPEHEIHYTYTRSKKKTTTTTNPGKSPFFTWNFVNRLKQTFLQIDLFVACSHRARPNSATIDSFVENWEACPLPSVLWLTYCQVPYTWLVCSSTKTKGKECGSNLSSRLWGEALRDDTENGCVADYLFTCLDIKRKNVMSRHNVCL